MKNKGSAGFAEIFAGSVGGAEVLGENDLPRAAPRKNRREKRRTNGRAEKRKTQGDPRAKNKERKDSVYFRARADARRSTAQGLRSFPRKGRRTREKKERARGD